MGGHVAPRSPLEATEKLVAGAFVRKVRGPIDEALEAKTDLSADAELLFHNLDALGDEAEELALQVLDRHVPAGWDAYVAGLASDVAGNNRDRRRAAAQRLLHVAGGRIGARYASAPKPNLERPAVWAALFDCLGHKDNVLRKTVAPSLAAIAHRAADRSRALERLVDHLGGPSRAECVDAIRAMVLHGHDVSSALPALGDGDDREMIERLERLRRGEVDAVIERFAAAPSGALASQLARARWDDMSPAVAYLAATLEAGDDGARLEACSACDSLARRGVDIGAAIDGLAGRLGDKARVGKSSPIGIVAAAALAASAARFRAAREHVVRGLGGPAAVAEHASFAAGQLACADASIDAGALLEAASNPARAWIYAGIAAGRARGATDRLAELVALVDGRLAGEKNRAVNDAAARAVDQLCQTLRFRGPDGASGLVALARTRWELARDIGLYDDAKAIDAIAAINHKALAADPGHREALALADQLAAARAAAIT